MEYHDPHVPELPKLGMTSVGMTAEALAGHDVVVVVTAATWFGVDMKAFKTSDLDRALSHLNVVGESAQRANVYVQELLRKYD